MQPRSMLFPNLCYDDAPAAIAFLCDAFGFERHAVFTDAKDDRLIQHAELVYQGQMIMLSSAALSGPFAERARMRTPRQAGGNTQAVYIWIKDVDAHAAAARAAGANIFMEPEDQSYGGRHYAALDPEGYAWSFGSYDPWNP